jgi:multimeric flavodoxin WrbA
MMGAVRSSDGVLWASPVYFSLVPSQLKRFIELVRERRAEDVFQGKYGAALVTSIHSMDHTAMNYLTGISEDLGMRFVGGFTPGMDDLEVESERTNLLNFAGWFFKSIEDGLPTLRSFDPLKRDTREYRPAAAMEAPKTGSRRIVVLTDGADPDSNLGRMIEQFLRVLPNPAEVFDLRAVDIRGGCQGCANCGYGNTCVYQDGHKRFIEEKLIPAEAVVYAGAIEDRYLSSRWKMYFDRSFVFGHVPYLSGKQMGFIISGPLRQLANLRQLFEAHSQSQRCTLAGFATDEGDADEVIGGLQHLAMKLTWGLERDLKAPPNYLGTGLHLLFRQFVPRSRGIFRADHIYYKRHGLYEDRHNDLRHKLRTLKFIAMNSVPSIRREFKKRMKHGMIANLKKIVDS